MKMDHYYENLLFLPSFYKPTVFQRVHLWYFPSSAKVANVLFATLKKIFSFQIILSSLNNCTKAWPHKKFCAILRCEIDIETDIFFRNY